MAPDQASVALPRTDCIGIERLCVFGLPPVPYVELAAGVHCRYIGIALTPMAYNPNNYPPWSLRDDPALRLELRAALAANDVQISLCEGFGIRRGGDVREFASDLDIVAELGIRRISAASSDRDRQRSFDQFTVLAEMAGERGIETTIEIGPGPVPDLNAALDAIAHVGRADFRLLIDTMHFVRFGSTAAQLQAIDPRLIGYLQLCDAPLVSPYASYMEEALYERLAPGAGELPLLDILASVPPEVVIGLEVPQRSRLLAGIDTRERVQHCVTAARALLSRVRPRIV